MRLGGGARPVSIGGLGSPSKAESANPLRRGHERGIGASRPVNDSAPVGLDGGRELPHLDSNQEPSG